jgi:hypothetical protein
MTRARDLADFQTALNSRPIPGSTGIPFRMASGSQAGGNNANVVITFPVDRFTQAPTIAIFPTSNSALVTPVAVYYSAKSASSMTVQIKTTSDGANIGYFDYVAVQMTSASGAG